ncbi:polymorphic toxin-type HINT domain-containing protein [Streptomyces sp. NPDC058398]|uniref:polymorphic toxin-type HINT domain-containing protein n=1 Tax=Streptomyces sp. NPDC058398 TaxID=3346479 RepID=UPI003667E8BE
MTNTLTYGYDRLGRQTSVSRGLTTLATWKWDSASGGKGQVASATSTDTNGNEYTVKTGAFDSRSRPTNTTITLPASLTGLAGDYTTKYDYDAADHITAVTYPAAGGLAEEKVTTTYNGQGQPTNLASPTQTYVKNAVYDSYGLLTERDYGSPVVGANKVTAQRNYDYDYTNGTRQLTGITTTTSVDQVTTQQRQQDTYTRDYASRITEIREQATSQTAQSQCFTYDDQSRLTEAYTRGSNCIWPSGSDFVGTAPYQTSYNYDQLGNLQTVTDTDSAKKAVKRDYLYPGYDDTGAWKTANAAQPHGVRKINIGTGSTVTGTEDFTYDTAGQMLKHTEPGKTSDYTWTPQGQLATATTTDSGGSKLSRYTYEADGALLVRTTPQETVAYLGGMEVRRADDKTTATRYYTSDGATVAMRTTTGAASGDTLTYLMADTQASTQVTVDASSGATTRRRYTPFGDERSGTLPTGTSHGFLGKTEDTNTGLSLLGARVYDPHLGRFLSPDPLLVPNNPQSLSAYSYSNNDPIDMSDPSGMVPCLMDGPCGGVKELEHFAEQDQIANPQHYDGVDNSSSDQTSTVVSGIPGSTSDGFYDTWEIEYASAYQWKHSTFGEDLSWDEIGDVGQQTCAKVECTREQRYYFFDIYMNPKKSMEIAALGDVQLGELGMLGLGKAAAKGKSLSSETPGGCAQCFLAGTDVLMADGKTKDIEDVHVGDKVLATDPKTGKTASREVLQLIITENDKHFNELSIATKNGVEKLTATNKHPFWSPSQDAWISAAALEPGMTLRTETGATVIVTGNRPFAKHARTYNLTVADLHTYYVVAGTTPILVHNSSCFHNSIRTESKYKESTKKRARQKNVRTDVGHVEFGENLEANGWTRVERGPHIEYQKDGARYFLRGKASSYEGWTADYYPPGEKHYTLKIRLGDES